MIIDEDRDRIDEGERIGLHKTDPNVGRVLQSITLCGLRPSIPVKSQMWEEPHMTDNSATPLQVAIREAVIASGRTRDANDQLLKKALGTTGKPLWDIERGKSKRPGPDTLRAIEQVLSLPDEQLVELVHPRSSPIKERPAFDADQPKIHTADAGEMVEIIKLDLSLPMGPGATVDDYIEEEPVSFDLGYVRGFTRTPPHRLRIARGVGDSMFPTLNSNDLVWIDSTQTNLNQQDRVWAVSINGAAAIKRLRSLKEGRVLVISDNPTIDNYEVGGDEIRIGGRVIRFARDL
jgi:phage repressor protein C with HTH and peptisase S24 domain